MHPDWIRNLRDQCVATGVPFHFKQWGKWLPYFMLLDVPIEQPPVKDMCWVDVHTGKSFLGDVNPYGGGGMLMMPVGKNSGRLLDGREWVEFPNFSPTASIRT